jgi:hypothetical protein
MNPVDINITIRFECRRPNLYTPVIRFGKRRGRIDRQLGYAGVIGEAGMRFNFYLRSLRYAMYSQMVTGVKARR